jgi:hypothetical protein
MDELIKIVHSEDGAVICFHSPHNTKYEFESLGAALAALPTLPEAGGTAKTRRLS